MLERNLSTGGTVVAAAILAGAAAGAVANPALFEAAFNTVLGWGVESRRAAALLCFLPVLLAGFGAGYAYDYATGQGAFAPAASPGSSAEPG